MDDLTVKSFSEFMVAMAKGAKNTGIILAERANLYIKFYLLHMDILSINIF